MRQSILSDSNLSLSGDIGGEGDRSIVEVVEEISLSSVELCESLYGERAAGEVSLSKRNEGEFLGPEFLLTLRAIRCR